MKSYKNKLLCARTHTGLKRKNNEDNYLIGAGDKFANNYGRLIAVADGMGGHAYGEIASKIACEGLAKIFKVKPPSDNDIFYYSIHQLENTIHQLHNKILDESLKNSAYEGMGTTLSVLLFMKDKALIAHVGDSRIYRLRQERLECLTVDHTMAQFLIAEKEFFPEDAINHPARNILTQALGIEIEKIDTRVEAIKPGDLFLLCSDGLYDMVSDDDLLELLTVPPPSKQSVCGQLMDAAMNNGGRDNVTVIVVKLQDSLNS